jgi:1,4-dihydroxy-2-naphthoate octaprenyltransferase
MDEDARDNRLAGGFNEGPRGFLHYAGFRYWTASLLPALVGTTLPFWLRPPGFSFRWLAAIEFLIATILLHAGFSFLQARFEDRFTAEWSKSRLLGAASVCIVTACLLGLHLNSFVPGIIFIVYGISAIFTGVLYVAPPFNFCQRVGGEVVISVGLGLIPILGAYLVQAGDLTRTVYLASSPVVVVTALWIWTDELITRMNDEKDGRQTMVILFGPRFSGQFVVLALSILFYTTLFLAVFTASIIPLALIALLLIGLVGKIVTVSWNNYTRPTRMLEARMSAFKLHLAICTIITTSSVATLLI